MLICLLVASETEEMYKCIYLRILFSYYNIWHYGYDFNDLMSHF